MDWTIPDGIRRESRPQARHAVKSKEAWLASTAAKGEAKLGAEDDEPAVVEPPEEPPPPMPPAV